MTVRKFLPDRESHSGRIENLRPDDYYNEDGLIVFTASYLLKRGKCCGNKCRHCPYGWANVKQREQED